MALPLNRNVDTITHVPNAPSLSAPSGCGNARFETGDSGNEHQKMPIVPQDNSLIGFQLPHLHAISFCTAPIGSLQSNCVNRWGQASKWLPSLTE